MSNNQNKLNPIKIDELIQEVQELIHNGYINRKWLRTSEIAKYLGISITQVHNLKKDGLLPFTKLAGTIYFNKTEIDKILEENKLNVDN